MWQNPEGPAVSNVTDVKLSDRFVDFWERIGIEQLIPNSRFSQMTYDLYCKAKLKNRVCKYYDIYYPSIVARKRQRQDGCGLEVLGNKVINEEDISQEEGENSKILIADGDDYHALIINIHELLMNSEFVEIQTDRYNWIIYLLSRTRYDIHVYVIYAYVKRWPILFT